MFRFVNFYNDPPPPPEPPPAKTFTQADVDRFLAEDRRKTQAKAAETLKQLEALQQNVKLTQEERDGLQQQIDTIKNESLSKEQQLTRDLEKANGLVKTTSETLTTERDTWQGRYGTLLINNRLTQAAADNDGFRADQFIDLLSGRSKIVEQKDADGKPTGEFKVLVKFEDVDPKTKQPVTLELEPDAVVKRMKEMPERFGNLFKAGVNGGIGKNKGTNTQAPSIPDMSTEEYRAYRKERDKK